jgi:hypothetical protein
MAKKISAVPVILGGATLGGHMVSHVLAGSLGGALVVAAASPAVRQAARRATVAALARGIVMGRTLARYAEEARLEAEDLLAEAQVAAGPDSAGSDGMAGEEAARVASGHGHAH